MRASIYVPVRTGFAALDELNVVPWATLRHAYGCGVTGSGIHDDVARSLRQLAHDPHEAMVGGLYANVCHQGTVYEATAYAVPFLVAVASGEIDHVLRGRLVGLIGSVAFAASFATEDGSHAGAYGAGVDVLIRGALAACAARLDAICAAAPELAAILRAVTAITAAPDDATRATLRAALDE